MAVVLDVLASYIEEMLKEMAKDELHMLLGVYGEINKMDLTIKGLKDLLADADRRSITDQSVQAWVRELRVAMYEATDILDLCKLKVMKQGLCQDVGCFNPLLFCMRNPLHAHDIGTRIKNLNQRLDGIKERSLAFSFINLNSYEDRRRQVASSRLASRETSGELDRSGVVGEKIKEDTRNLVNMLTKEEETKYNKIRVFAIVGVGGIGKTTLAKNIFNDEVIQQVFTKKIWLSVNQNYNEAELLNKAITEAREDHEVREEHETTGSTKGSLERALKKSLMGHKTLLVMDDVWDERAWEDVLKTPLVNVVAGGSRVLVTTRKDTVARGMIAVEPYHHVDKLGPEDAWSLLKKQVVGNEYAEPEIDNLKGVGMEIIAKCDGLPLAVKVMGGLLRQKRRTQGDWEKVLNKWVSERLPEELNNAVYLSYEDLDPTLKQCFLHFSLLPKPLRFYDADVVGMWISEGFVLGNSHGLEESGRDYYDELLSRNLIEPKRSQHHCTMHDLVRAFGHCVARHEALAADTRETDITSKLISNKFVRLSLCNETSESNVEWSSLQAQKSLRTLVSIGPIRIKHGDSLVHFSSLRTLHLHNTDCHALVKSLHQLKHLRYLSLEICGISTLSENIGKMKFLQYIRLSRNESLARLPDSIVKLHQLRALYFQQTRINNIPRGFEILRNMRNLCGFPAHMDGEWCSLQELGPLSQLSSLQIAGLENVSASSFATKAMLAKKVHLRKLNLHCTTKLGDDSPLVKGENGVSEEEQQQIEEVFDQLCPPSCLEELGIIGYFGRQLPRWMISTAVAPFENMRILEMRDLACCTELPGRLCKLPCLEILRIVRAPAIKRVGAEFLLPYHHDSHLSQVAVVFRKLRELTFRGMVEWEEWEWEEQVHLQAMPILEEVVIQSSKLRRLPPGLAFHARALRRLVLHDVAQLSSLENFHSVTNLYVGKILDLERISNLTRLQELSIVNCPKVKILEGVPALDRLMLSDCNMGTLPGHLQGVHPRHLEVHCTLSLLTSIAAARSSPEWNKFSHIRHVMVYEDDEDIPGKRYVLYTRDPFHFETNVSRCA